MAQISIKECAQTLSGTQKLPSVIIQGNITAMRYQNDENVFKSYFLLTIVAFYF